MLLVFHAGSVCYLSPLCSKKSVSDVYSQGKICVLDIDMQGVRSIKATDLAPVYVFIKPPSMEELVSELISACYVTVVQIFCDIYTVTGLLKVCCEDE